MSLCEIFWQKLADSESQMIIVFDNAKNVQQIRDLLPNNDRLIGGCRILVIGIHKMNIDDIYKKEQMLSYFSEEEAIDLFRQQMGEDQLKIYLDKINEIARRLEYLPQLLYAAARNFSSGKVSPNTYALMLQKGEDQSQFMVSPAWKSLDLVIRELNSDQVDIFDLFGVLGEGNWHYNMLAAVALRSSSDVKRDLGSLVERDLVKEIGDNRYRVSTFIRAFAEHRFEQRPDYLRQMAYSLLARYCLDIAQDIDADLNSNPDIRTVSGQSTAGINEAVVRTFQKGLMPEMSHIRRVLERATSREDWDILRRFSYFSYMELLKDFTANSFEIRKSCLMTTIHEPLIWLQGDRKYMHVQTYGISPDIEVRRLSNSITSFTKEVNGNSTTYWQDELPYFQARCELSLDISAGHIIDGVFESMNLIDARWIGVRANGLICKDVDIVGGQFLACELNHSVWVNCDARRVTMLSSKLRFALLKNMKLQGAYLREIDLMGAVLENVDLRGSDLRGANLTGTMLRNVDLRDADLRGANLTAAQADDVELRGCRIDNVCWAGVRPHRFILEDPALLKEIEIAAAKPVDSSVKHITRRWRPTAALDKLSDPKFDGTDFPTIVLSDVVIPDFSNADLRGVDLQSRSLTEYIFRGADLRAAQLQATVLEKADLSDASLRAADLQHANLAKSDLRGADLRTAILNHANLKQSDLTKAILRSAQFVQADLQGAQMKSADLRRANLSDANLTNAVLANADLTDANIRRATLRCIDLGDADLHSADLADADMTDANLTAAICIGTNFRSATVADHQLAQADRLDGATLPEGQRVEVLDDVDYKSISSQISLRFAHFDGIFKQLDLRERDMRGAHLDGTFVQVNLAGVDLAHGRFSGKLSRVNCSATNMTSARLSGTFFEVDFRSADFQGANLSNANLVNADLTGALNVNDDQLRQAKRLRGTIMPDGSRYDGRFNLIGDREDAPNAGVNPDDPVAMKRFVDGSKPKFVPPVPSS